MASAAETLLLHGFAAWTGWKKPVDLCSTTDHPQSFLVGEQTIDGVLAMHGMRVLLRGQIPARENGIFVVNSLGPWTRAKDFDSETSMLPGSTIVVCQGTNNSGVYRMTTPVSGTVTPGSTSMAFSKVGEFSTSILTALGIEFPGDAEIAAGGGANELTLTASTTHVAGPLTVQGYGHDPKAVLSWKQPVRVATTADIFPMAGLLTVDGVNLSVNDRVLVKNNAVATGNGIYVVQNASWTRATDCDTADDLVPGFRVAVISGTANAGKTFYFANTSTATPGVSNLTFTEVAGGGGSYTAGDGLTLTGSDFDIDLADTTIFTSSGVAGRVPVISADPIGLQVARINPPSTSLQIGTSNVTSMVLGRSASSMTVDSSSMALRSAGNIALRPTGDTVDTLVCAVVSGACKLSSTKAVKIESTAASTAGAIELAAASTSTVVISGGGLSMSANGSVGVTSGTGCTVTAGSSLILQSTGGTANVVAPSTQVVNVNGSRFEIRSADRVVKFQNYAASEDALTLTYPAQQTLSADGLTTLATLSPPTGAVWFVRGSIRAWDSSTNAWTSDFRFGLKNVAGTVTTFNVVKTEAGSGGSMASMASDLPGAGATALIRASRPAGVSVTVKCHYWIEA